MSIIEVTEAPAGSTEEPVRHRRLRSGTLPARGHASGPAPHRILLAGGAFETAAAFDGRSFAGALSADVAGFTAHGADVEVAGAAAADLESALAAVARADVESFDAVVLGLVPAAERRWAPVDELARLQLRRIAERLPERSPIVVAVAGPLDADVRAALVRVLALLPRSAVAVDLPAPTDRRAGWSAPVAEALAARLRDPHHWTSPRTRVDEPARVDAVRDLKCSVVDWSGVLGRTAQLARHLYGTSSAAISVIDDVTIEYTVQVGACGDAIAPRADSICDTVLGLHGGLILEDAAADARFSSIAPVREGVVRFYAGQRIRDVHGAPIGVLCVFDAEPRPVVLQDLAPLRDLAAAAERGLAALHARSD